MTDIAAGLAQLRALVESTEGETRQQIREAIDVLLLAAESVARAYAVTFPPCLQQLTAEQQAALKALVNQAVLEALQQLTLKIGIESAGLAIAASGAKH